MLKTPEHITKQYGITPTPGPGRAIPRVLLAYSGANKSRFLAITFSSIVAGALPEYGQNRNWRKDVTQAELAAMCNVSRETYTRWMSESANPDESWTVDRRIEQRDRTRRQHEQRGHRLHDRQRLARSHVASLILRRRRFMRPNVYTPALPTRAAAQANQNLWYPGRWDEISRHPEIGGLFARLEGDPQGFGGFKHIPHWLWDPKLPLSCLARMVMTYYFMVGLGSPDKRNRGKLLGVIKPKQPTVADALGISVRSVYNANRELADLSLIRVAHSKPAVGPDGNYNRGPQIIIYLPIRTLTTEEADYERQRLLFAIHASRSGTEPSWQVPRLQELHGALLSEWTGKEHSLGAFWNELRRRAVGEGIFLRDVINRLVPSPPE